MNGLIKVVTPDEMSRIEKIAIGSGCQEADFMENAGKGIAAAIFNSIKTHPNPPHCFVFIGKGNNGGDAFTAAFYLQAAGIIVHVIALYQIKECSVLCQNHWKRYADSGGVIRSLVDLHDDELSGGTIIVDGMVGTGFNGKPHGMLLEGIQKINRSSALVFAVDIPSGLCGSSGCIQAEAVKADYTLFLELPKLGFFMGKGWEVVGKCIQIGFGMPHQFIIQAQASALLVSEEAMVCLLPPIKKTRHKYEAGYVLAFAGSQSMLGAAMLSCMAALHAGSGIVRLYSDIGAEACFGAFEVIKQSFNLESIRHELNRASSFLIGPGIGRCRQAEERVGTLLKEMSRPCVIDADALFFLAEHPEWILPSDAVLTPHQGEMRKLLGIEEPADYDTKWWAECISYAKKRGTVLVVKGAPTVVFSSSEIPVIIPFGDPGMATAGSGDVLTGIIAALLSQKVPSLESAVLGVYLHAKAGEAAAKDQTSYSMVASDIIEHLPDAFKTLLERD